MQISPEQGQCMALLVKLTGARRAIEIGVFTGYSALSVATALPDDGTLLACDISDGYTRVGRRYREQAGVAHKIDLRLAPALVPLDARLAAGEAGRYDFAFIDADKAGYDAHDERCLQLVRQGGLVAIDNTLWGGVGRQARDRRRHGGRAAAQRQAARRRAHRPLAASDRRRPDAGAQALKAAGVRASRVRPLQESPVMSIITTRDGAEIFYKPNDVFDGLEAHHIDLST